MQSTYFALYICSVIYLVGTLLHILIVICNCSVCVRFVSMVSEKPAATEDFNHRRFHPDLQIDHVGMDKP